VIDEALRRKNTPEYLVEMIRLWLSDRELLIGEEMTPRPVTCGVPQGSVLGPTLWNVSYNSLLEMSVPRGVHLVGFADDLAVIGACQIGQSTRGCREPGSPSNRHLDDKQGARASPPKDRGGHADQEAGFCSPSSGRRRACCEVGEGFTVSRSKA